MLFDNREEVPKMPKQPVLSCSFFISDDGNCWHATKPKKAKCVFFYQLDMSLALWILRSRKWNQTQFCITIKQSMPLTLWIRWHVALPWSQVRRWPLAMFFNVLDMAAINAFILFRKVTGRNLSRRQFLKELVVDLVTPSKQPVQPFGDIINKCAQKRRQCHRCRNKTGNLCSFCERPACGQCVSEKRLQLKCSSCYSSCWWIIS